MKKIIYFFGILFLGIVFILNILFTANLNAEEHITIRFNNIGYILGLILVGILILIGTNYLDKWFNNNPTRIKKKIRNVVLVMALAIYISFNIIWVVKRQPGICGDQIHVINFAQTIYRDDPNEFLPNLTYAGIPLSEYIQGYKQQIPLAFIYSIFFKIIHTDWMFALRGLNVIANIFIVIALYKISKQLSKKHKTNKSFLLTLILTFISLPMLATFIYGDIPGLALSLFSVYYIMRYTETKKFRYGIISAAFAMLGYMMRMNSLIFIIATVMYLCMDWFEKIKEQNKEIADSKEAEKVVDDSVKQNRLKSNILGFAMIIVFIVISIIPASIVENHYMNKYGMDKTKAYPRISFFLLGMSESHRANGWYLEDIGETALKNPQEVKEEYKGKIKERLQYFTQNIGYTFKFYTDKIISMWSENTYSSVMNNKTSSNDKIVNMIEPLTFYQKILLILATLCSLIVMIQNRKNMSLEILFLVTIFIGGFAFHILWEAKSRYIIPYIIAILPLASVEINTEKIKSMLSNIKNRFKKVKN